MAASSSLTLGFLLHLLLLLLVSATAQEDTQFSYEGFDDNGNLTLQEAAQVTTERTLQLTNMSRDIVGRAFHNRSIQMLHNSSDQRQKASSFSAYFVFSIVPSTSAPGGFGLAFVLAPFKDMFEDARDGHYLGIYNDSNYANGIFAVEFDTVNGSGEGESDSEANEVGINIKDTTSFVSERAAYVGNDSKRVNFSFEEVDAVQAWIDYDGDNKIVNVTVAPMSVPRPSTPLLSTKPADFNLTAVITQDMYAGFSASTGASKASSHYILGWSFAVNAPARMLDFSKLPRPPSKVKDPSSFPWVNFAIGVLSSLTLILLLSLCSVTLYKRYTNFETLEDWELDCPHRFRYRDLRTATKDFKESELIGVGGFGSVYKGVLPSTGTEVAVKRIMRGPIQGMREFAAEIESLGRLRHKNLVNLQGWCKQKNDLLLIYDYIPNGSLDSLLFKQSLLLNWEQRFNIIKGVANGLLYLHEDWEQVVVHRDIKTSNILIDGDLNARLGDFGLARLYDHGEASHTTNVVGTIGYIAPELTRTGKASTSSDVYAYGVVLLEVVSGRKAVGPGQFFLVDWVVENHNMGQILEVVDPKLGSVYVEEEVELVLKLGLLCAQHNADSRPTTRQVMRYLNFDDPLPDMGDWRRQTDSGSGRMSLGFLEIVSTSTSSTSYNITSNSGMNSRPIQAGR